MGGEGGERGKVRRGEGRREEESPHTCTYEPGKKLG